MTSLQQAVLHLEQGEWEAAHRIVQEDESPLSSWAHGVVHLMEGDVGNARYWYGRAGRELPKVSWDDAAVRDAAIGAEITALRAAV